MYLHGLALLVWHWIAYNYTHGSVRTGHKTSAGQDDVVLYHTLRVGFLNGMGIVIYMCNCYCITSIRE